MYVCMWVGEYVYMRMCIRANMSMGVFEREETILRRYILQYLYIIY